MSRPKIGYRTGSKESYNEFCTNNPSLNLSFEDYKKILYTYNASLVAHLLETGDKIKMPFGLGELVVNKYKPKRYKIAPDGTEYSNLPINWQETKKEGKYVYYMNAHSDGYKYYWMWNYWKTRMKFSYIWKFEMARVNSRLLKTYLKKPNSKYKDLYREYPRTK
jgi:hypothetical protein